MFEESEDDTAQKSGMKRFWSYIKSLKKDTISIQALNHHGKLVTTGREKADALSDQYLSVFTKPSQDQITYNKNVLCDPMRAIIISEKGVLKLIHRLKINKAVDPDLIPTRILKDYADIIATVLTVLFQKSVDTGTTPKDWR